MTKSRNLAGVLSKEWFVANSSIQGVARAVKLAMNGNLISAFKYIEAANPDFSREKAKEIVRSFGYWGVGEVRALFEERGPKNFK